MSSLDRVVFASDFAVGARRDLNGMLLLESALQLPISKQDDLLCVELPLPEVICICYCRLTKSLYHISHYQIEFHSYCIPNLWHFRFNIPDFNIFAIFSELAGFYLKDLRHALSKRANWLSPFTSLLPLILAQNFLYLDIFSVTLMSKPH